MLTTMKYRILMTVLIVINVSLTGIQSRSIRDQIFYRKVGNAKENLLDLADTGSHDSSLSLSLSDSEPIKAYSSIQSSLISKKPLDCQNFETDLIECFAYNLFLKNSEKFQYLDSENVLIKPILTKQFINKTVNSGENVTFTCETQIDALPVFLFYKLNASILNTYSSMLQYNTPSVDLLDKYAQALQDNHDLFNDYATVDPRFILQRRDHSKDPNKDPLSDLETIDLHIINVTKSDSAYYLCIVANNLNSFRVTYAYLTVNENQVEISTSSKSNIANVFTNSSYFTNELLSKDFETYVHRNKFILLGILCFILLIVLIMAVSMCYCCLQCMRTKRMKEKFKYSAKKDFHKEHHLSNGQSSSKMNALLERTMSSMRKNFVYSSMSPDNINQSSISTSTSTTTNCSTLNSQNCIMYAQTNHFNNDIDQEFAEKLNLNFINTDSSWEFQKEKLKLGKLLDEGAFGRVFMAEAYGILPGRYKTQVAVKMLKENSSKEELTNFLKELEIMKSVGKHENVISLLGCCTKMGPIYAIVEYAKFGNLRNYLRSQRPKDYMLYTESKRHHRNGSSSCSSGNESSSDLDEIGSGFNKVNNFTDNILKLYSSVNKQKKVFISDKAVKANHAISENNNNTSTSLELMNLSIDLIRFCVQISNGMMYLHTKKVCHRDLAARNILLDEFKVAKIADFGFARDLQQNYYYTRKAESPIPVKWMSPETLFDRKFYKNSDIWSFGVLMWEIFTLGGNPYPSVPVEKLFDYLKDGNRMSKPMYCDDEIYQLILDCWHFKSDMRPSFEEINKKLLIILDKYETKKVQLVKLNEMEKYLQIDENKDSFDLEFGNLSGDHLNINSLASSNIDIPLPPPPPMPLPLSLTQVPENNTNNNNNVKITRKIINKNLNDPKRIMSSIQSESEDSQYFSGADSSIVYADSCNFSSASSAYSNYSVAPPSMMAPSSIETPPSPPPLKSLAKLLNVASAAYNL